MPKIVVTVVRKLATRSKTVGDEEKAGDGHNNQTPSEAKKSGTPNRAGAKGERKVKLEEERRTVRAAERKFFTVGEDQQILAVLKSLGASKTSREIAETISKKMSHSVESIRDRIKRFLTRIRPVDEAYIAEEAKNNSHHYVHFTKENSKGKRTVSHIEVNLPKVAGSTLNNREKKENMKAMSRLRKIKYSGLEQASSVQRVRKSKESEKLQNMTTEQLFKLRDDQVREMKEKNQEYKVKLRKREPKVYVDPTEFLSPVIKKKERYQAYFKEKAQKSRDSQNDLKDKVDMFIQQLNSKQESDVEMNAQILAEIIKNFSLTFGASNEDILEVIKRLEGNLNVEDIRRELLARGV